MSSTSSYSLTCASVDALTSAWAKSGRHWSRAVVAATLVFLASEFVAATIHGELGSPNDVVRGVQDIAAAILRNDDHVMPTSMPLLRDVPMILVAMALGVQTGNVYRQWVKIDRMPEVMVAEGTIQDKDGVLLSEIEKANDLFSRVRNYSLLAGVVAFSLTMLVLSSHAKNGVYSIYNPADGVYGRTVYAGWWANVSNTLGVLSVSGIGMLSAYYLVLQNVVGLRILMIIQRVTYPVQFKGLKPTFSVNRSVAFVLDPHHEDGCRGWRPMDQVFRTIFTAVMASTVALTFLIIQLGPGRSIWIGWGLAIFFVLNPTYILVPMLLFHLRLRAWRRDRLATLRSQIAAREAASSVPREEDGVIARLEAARREIAAVSCAPFAGMRTYRFALAFLAAFLNFVVALLTVRAFL